MTWRDNKWHSKYWIQSRIWVVMQGKSSLFATGGRFSLSSETLSWVPLATTILEVVWLETLSVLPSSEELMLTNVRCTTWLRRSIIHWKRCRWNWWVRSSGAVGVRSSVPRSMLGYDLRRLVSEKLPYKPGTKLVVHHENRKLTLDQTLGEQGI